MKSLYVTFESEEYKRLLKKKGTNTWRNFILTLLEEKND